MWLNTGARIFYPRMKRPYLPLPAVQAATTNILTPLYSYTVKPSIADTLGEQHFGRYIEVAFIEGSFCTQTVHLGPGCLAVIQRWPLFRGGRSEGFHCSAMCVAAHMSLSCVGYCNVCSCSHVPVLCRTLQCV